MNTWVEEFRSLKSDNKVGIDARKSTKTGQLEAELKLLEWHKLANNAAMKVIFLFLVLQTNNPRCLCYKTKKF